MKLTALPGCKHPPPGAGGRDRRLRPVGGNVRFPAETSRPLGDSSVGLPDAGGGGVGLDPLAAVLSDLAVGAAADESTVRKLTRRIGAKTVSELTRAMIVKVMRERRFRPRAVRIDSTVMRPT
jgi:hypothetical protein